MRFIWIIVLMGCFRLGAAVAATNGFLGAPILVHVTGMLGCNNSQYWNMELKGGIGYRLHSVERYFAGGEEVSREVNVSRLDLKQSIVLSNSGHSDSRILVVSRFEQTDGSVKPIWCGPWGVNLSPTGLSQLLSTNVSIEVRARLKKDFIISDAQATSMLEAVWRHNGEVFRIDTLALSVFKIQAAGNEDDALLTARTLEPLPKDFDILLVRDGAGRTSKRGFTGLDAKE